MSKVKFRCFNCDSKLEIPDKYAGRKGRCPKCKAKNTIPSSEDTLEDSIMILFNDIDDYGDENDEPDPFSLTQDGLDDMGEPEQIDSDSYTDKGEDNDIR